MKKKLIISLTLLTLFVAACAGQPTQMPPKLVAPTQAVAQPTSVPTSANTVADSATPTKDASVAGVSFANDVMPIFESSCTDCHGVKQIKEGLDLRTYESLMAGSFNGTVLVAGNSADSFLVEQVTKGKMPKRGPKLTAEQIKIISDWINAGALNN